MERGRFESDIVRTRVILAVRRAGILVAGMRLVWLGDLGESMGVVRGGQTWRGGGW